MNHTPNYAAGPKVVKRIQYSTEREYAPFQMNRRIKGVVTLSPM